ncbi:hypoxanthine phosphoribosyltransferase [Alicyclobacillus tolerans]|uniref:Hypoxanthine phosphoribosyltransferase n=2 Tax=Alicyclobacillus tolerans TaxID=90970 RepID=A0ABT9LZS4_9BACL|nr:MULTISPECIES: hypoxanthine phosphoribosyltransferase [Alicyclobacillus]MDP9729769.1 hypoxanthine phosphoribosyltransferase [Alicyclobacillus tengchongensis]QRF22370.1 hypoxanthine phosphoribosyltransferase [Alicyclobacillus sp. TC]SHK06348.1 hypoxanthine phosphoribosyltransferase [Alicyclobacillus montanus]
MQKDLESILFDEEQIQQRIQELGKQLAVEYNEKNPLFICVLKGAVLFMADLIKRVDVPLEIDFMATSSYGDASKSSGVVRILKDLDRPVEGRHVVIVEDIVDSGLTLRYLRETLLHRKAASVKIVSLFDKPEGRQVDIEPDWFGFRVPNAFIVGYGLDYAERYRNLPYVGILKAEIYQES